jgi:hypothetical protein
MESNKKNSYLSPNRFRKYLDEEVLPQDVDFDPSKFKSGLTSKIWQKDGQIKPEIRKKLLAIAKEFYDYLKLPYPIKDIYVTGSIANYNWTDKSDIDVHLQLDYTVDPEEEAFISEYIFAKKNLWSCNHDITIYGFPVELFAKNIEEEHGSKSIYSLMQNKWLKKPSKIKPNIDVDVVREKAAAIMNKIEKIEDIKDLEKKYKESEKLKDKLRNMRSSGLKQGGEYSTENLVFKALRNSGYLDRLWDVRVSAFDKSMSLNEGVNRFRGSEKNDSVEHTLKVQKDIPGMTDEKIEIVKDFICFVCGKLGIKEPVTVVLKKGRDETINTTASYLPFENENHIRAGGRALIDILGSIAHELTHNRQRELGKFNPGDAVQNIGGHIEDEANAMMGILKKDFTHNYGYDNIYEL